MKTVKIVILSTIRRRKGFGKEKTQWRARIDEQTLGNQEKKRSATYRVNTTDVVSDGRESNSLGGWILEESVRPHTRW